MLQVTTENTMTILDVLQIIKEAESGKAIHIEYPDLSYKELGSMMIELTAQTSRVISISRVGEYGLKIHVRG